MSQSNVLANVINLFKSECSESLVGIYLHGSMAMECFNPSQSDIDLLVIVKEKLPVNIYKGIARKLIHIEKEYELLKGFEISVVLERYAHEFVYPTPFEFHYSAFHKEKYAAEEHYFCGGYEDPDLAAHFVVIYNRGVVLYGAPVKEVFKPVPNRYYIDSIQSDVKEALEEIIDNPVYYVLNLARVLQYLRESVVSSKKEAGEWALTSLRLPEKYADVVKSCLEVYKGNLEKISLDEDLLLSYAQHMLNEIGAACLLSDNQPEEK